MGRYLARVPLDFSAPLDEPYAALINPHPYADNCSECGGHGLTPEAHKIDQCWYAHLSSEEQLPPGRAPKVEYDHPAVQAFSRRQVMRNPEFYAPMVDRIIGNAIEDGWSLAEAQRVGAEYIQRRVDDEARRLCKVCYNDSLRYRLTQEEITAMQKAGLFNEAFRVTLPKLRRRPASKKRRIINKWRKDPKNWVAEEASPRGDWQPWEWVQLKQPRMTRDRMIKMMVWEGMFNVINQYAFLKWWCKRHNLTLLCPKCNGGGIEWPSEEAKATYEAWEEGDHSIPKGPGYQIWCNTGEDCPLTPVFDTLEGVCKWAADNKVSVFGHSTATKEQWLAQFSDKEFVMIEEGNLAFV